MSAPPPQIFTVGHSNHSIEDFVAPLLTHGVQMLGDVHSQPYSRFRQHFK